MNPNERRTGTPRYNHLPHITEAGIDATDKRIQEVATENMRLQAENESLRNTVKALQRTPDNEPEVIAQLLLKHRTLFDVEATIQYLDTEHNYFEEQIDADHFVNHKLAWRRDNEI